MKCHAKYGADKLTYEQRKKKSWILAFAWVINFPFFKTVDKKMWMKFVMVNGWTFNSQSFLKSVPESLEIIGM
jgi:hypothetical protein